MKALRTTIVIAAVALLFATACDDKDTEWVTAPSISPTSAVVTAPDEGGSVSLTYTVSNPVDDATTTAVASASWISDVSVPSEGTVSFTAAANPTFEPRTGRITITYSYTLAGTKGTVSCDVTVAQSCGDEPALSVQPTAVAADAEGGSYSFEYTIVNPDAEGSVSAATDAEWITDIDTATSGKVSFTVAENTGEDVREGEITITYTYPSGSIYDAVAVVQDFPEGTDAPEISVINPTITAAVEGGSYSFGYEVLNPTDGGKMEVATEEEWITGLADSNGIVSFTVGENTGNELRSGVITLTYTYSKGYVSETVTIVQDHPNVETVEITGTYIAFGYRYSGDMNWTMTIHKDTGDPTKYWVDGLTPSDAGEYEESGTAHCAYGSLGADGTTFVIPTQLCADWLEGDSYVGWSPCVRYDGNWYYSGDLPDLTFTYDTDTGTWISDYGIFLGAFSSKDLDSFYGYFDVVAPPITIAKTADIKSLSSDRKGITGIKPFTGMMAK